MPDGVPQKLMRIEHIVVLQLENRSFDHMLGYLALDGNELPSHGELGTKVNGLAGATNSYRGVAYGAEILDEDAFDKQDLDPPHSDSEVKRQIAGGAMTGFLEAWAAKLSNMRGWRPVRLIKRAWAKLRHKADPGPDLAKLKTVMGYMPREKLPVFDHLARHFCVCDHWFCSVAGPTMPNRFFSIAGEHDNEMNNLKLLVLKKGKFKSLFQELRDEKMWRWYSSDPAVLRAIDKKYRFDTDEKYDHFAYFDEWTEVQRRTFLSDVLKDEELPEVAWIDPNFAIKDQVKLVGGLLDGPGSNDDHPPSHVIEAQRLVNKIYEALGRSSYWANTLFVVYYDEHGGFYDHVAPPDGMGPRIPALVVGGRVKRGVCQDQFDHASLIKTILLRFGKEGSIERMPARVAAADDLSSILRDDDEVVPFVPVANPGRAAISDKDLEPVKLEKGASVANRTMEVLDEALTDLQKLIVKHHALPLRTGRDKLSRLPTATLTNLVLGAVRKKPAGDERLPDRHP
jgi:phospholipase C